MYIEPGHLTFNPGMPSGYDVLRVIEASKLYGKPIRPRRNLGFIGQARSAVGTEPAVGERRRIEVLRLALREPDRLSWE